MTPWYKTDTLITCVELRHRHVSRISDMADARNLELGALALSIRLRVTD